MDEGIVAVEGVYVVRYFLGGSGCCVAESGKFKVVHRFSAECMHGAYWLERGKRGGGVRGEEKARKSYTV